ncbi:MBL fold metallo-hydrolase [Carboxylicivirga sp. RSCT41]|uniref:MBL fold metallo-hydrolase n=1 Tax=Carboxylicivirga agarovorans TaxID=3417570 RepID=UPI003D32CF51
MKSLVLLVLVLLTSCLKPQKEIAMENVQVQLIRNATLKITYAGKTFLVDPVLGKKHSFMSFVEPDKNLNPTVDLPVSIADITKDVDALLITHVHPDHFDTKAMEVLDKNIPVYSQVFDSKAAQDAGFKTVIPVNEKVELDGIQIIRTGGQHGPEETLEMLGKVSGFVLKKENYPTLYIVGDCIWTEEIEQTIKASQPDVIITNSGGAVFMGQSRILMDEHETAKVAQTAPEATVIAVHMEALDHCATTRDKVTAVASENNLNILVPANGEVINL